MIELTLARETGISLDALDCEMREDELIDLWHSLLESKGIDVRSARDKAVDEGFTQQELDRAMNMARGKT